MIKGQIGRGVSKCSDYIDCLLELEQKFIQNTKPT